MRKRSRHVDRTASGAGARVAAGERGTRAELAAGARGARAHTARETQSYTRERNYEINNRWIGGPISIESHQKSKFGILSIILYVFWIDGVYVEPPRVRCLT